MQIFLILKSSEQIGYRMVTQHQRVVNGFLIDLDGVLYEGETVIPGAVDTLHFLLKKQIPFLLITNTTRKSRFGIQNKLQRMGFRIPLEQIFSAPYAAAEWLRAHQAKSLYLFVRGDVFREFSEFKSTLYKPEYIVIGDMGEDLTYERLNQAFRMIMGGARIIALQKNRFWKKEDGLVIDAGAIVAALEYATRKRAIVIGKPRREFFRQAIKRLGLPAEKIAIIGDDLEADIQGGARVGLFTIAVKTGKFREQDLQRARLKPDLILGTFADLPKLFKF